MRRRAFLHTAAALAATALSASVLAKPAQRGTPRPDAADRLVGVWSGEVISDSKGSSKSDVSLTITKVGPGRIQIQSSYARLATITIPVMAASGKIIARSGPHTVFYDPDRSPPQLELNWSGEVAWSGHRRG